MFRVDVARGLWCGLIRFVEFDRLLCDVFVLVCRSGGVCVDLIIPILYDLMFVVVFCELLCRSVRLQVVNAR